MRRREVLGRGRGVFGMATGRYVVGIDCSTTATKAVVWDEEGNSVAEGRAAIAADFIAGGDACGTRSDRHCRLLSSGACTGLP